MSIPFKFTPYRQPVRFIQGASMQLRPTDDIPETLLTMRNEYNLNTISVYGLHEWRYQDLRDLAHWLRRAGMKIIVRLEAYPDSFSFQPSSDVPEVLNMHRWVIRAFGMSVAPTACFTVNMPVDDARVTDKLGGVNSELCRQHQIAYAFSMVQKLRRVVSRPIHLGVFYGWDGSYNIPSYGSAGADGYTLTSYSYSKDDDETLINKPRLRGIVGKFVGQYPEVPPVITEYGFHTNTDAQQKAGMVANQDAKWQALQATTDFYLNELPGYIGSCYFSYNIDKLEGDPPAILDWSLTSGGA